MDRLFRAMRNPERARGPGAMDPTSTSVDGLETVETRHYKISKAPPARHRCAGRCANGGQLRWTVAPRKHSSAKTRSVERLLRLARTSRAHGSWLGQPAEPPDADPHVRSCGRGGRAAATPIPIETQNLAALLFLQICATHRCPPGDFETSVARFKLGSVHSCALPRNYSQGVY